MKFRPLSTIGFWFVAQKKDERSAGGIIIPDTAKEKTFTGRNCRRRPWSPRRVRPLGSPRCESVKVGDRVLFGKWSGTEVKVGGEELLIMKESDVLGIIDGGRKTAKKTTKKTAKR